MDTGRNSSLRVGFAIEAPFAFLDEHGRVTGEAPEIFRRMAQRAGVESIDWVRLDFASLLTELRLGRIDAIAAGMYVTPERSKQVAFTRPTATVRTALVMRKGDTAVPRKPRLQDLDQGDPLRWATVHEAAENELLTNAGVPPERIGTVPSADRGLRAVAESSADVFVISSVTAAFQVSRHPEWPLEVRTLTDAPVGLPAFAFRLEDVELRNSVDAALSSFLGTPEHRELVEPFGLTVEEPAAPSP
jgi:polar amino acid transport system substrate-binding protein